MSACSSVSTQGNRRKKVTIEDALTTATENGYHINGLDGMATDYAGANSEFSAWTRKDNHSSFMIAVEETFLDPEFWQALGGALGWSEACDLSLTCGHAERCSYRGYYWMYQWHRFIQALAQGNPPAAFFATLTPSQQCPRGGGGGEEGAAQCRRYV
jgi:hypothetical protein